MFNKILAKKFDEQIVSLLLRMYEPVSEGSDISLFTKLVSVASTIYFLIHGSFHPQ